MDKFREMLAFAAVVDAGSFVGAADTLNTSKAAVSRHVNDLEQRLGVRLLNRTTRKLSLTDDGQNFLPQCKDILSAIEQAESQLSSHSAEASGMLRVSAPVTFGVLHLAELWGDFLQAHPKVTLDVSLSDRTVDLVEEGFDVAIRISASPHPTLIDRKLATTRVIVCATPTYLARHGTPTHPDELASHDIISYSYWSSRDEWTFEGPQEEVSVRTRSRMYANNGDTCLAAALDHQGIILQPDFLVAGPLQRGELVPLLPGYLAPEIGIHAVYASRKQLPLKVRKLIDFLVEAFRHPAWSAPA
jgi:DNA-binding transcriptional LysR family regulator